jgi:outer membrane protein assembly factor BamB
MVDAAEEPADSLAKAVLDKAGVRAGVCEMPRVGDGTLAAALARAGVPQVHALAPDANAAEAARKPAVAGGVMGSQVVIETGGPDALPLGDWVADLYLVTDATDANLKTLSAAEAGRVLSPFRGTAVVGNPAGTKAGLSKVALSAWAKDAGGTATISEDAGGLWAVVKMRPLAGADDWSHYYHGPDGNPVSKDTAFIGSRYQLQWHDMPMQGERNYTMVASAGRLFVAACSMYFGPIHSWVRPQQPFELEARGLYNAKLLWRRPISARFGDMGSLLAATPDRLYAKDGAGVLVLDPESGAELGRIAVAAEPRTVRWLVLSDGVLLTLAGPQPFSELLDAPRLKGETDAQYEKRVVPMSRERDACQELAAWDAATGKRLWQFKEARIMPRKMAVSSGRVFLYINDREALCLALGGGKELWRKAAPSAHTANKLGDVAQERRGEMLALATPQAYVIFDPQRRQHQAFDAVDGHVLWTLTKGQGYPAWANPDYPLLFGNTLISGGVVQCDVLTGKPAGTYPKARSLRSDSCGHTTALEAGLWIGDGVWDMAAGKQLMPRIDKSGCGAGYFVADGVEVLYPNMCTCYYTWSGMFVTRAASARGCRASARFEQGRAATPTGEQAGPRDWPTYRADDTRRGSSAAEVPAQAGIRWIYTPARPKSAGIDAALPGPFAPDRAATQPIAVGRKLFFGTPEGAVVCLDRATGAEAWRYWTAGAVRSAPTWAAGRIYAGSADGWVYCLDAASGALCWRYRVAPAERRITLLGQLGSAWPVWSGVLVHDGVAYAAAGLRGKLDGSALCALDARSGAVKWQKFMENAAGETDDKGNLLNQAPSGGGQMAWHGGKLWWHGGEWGLAVVDPARGTLRRAVNYRACDDFRYGMNEDLGILPGGWVTIGGWKPAHGVPAVLGSYQSPALFLRCGPQGLPAGKATAGVLADTAAVPHLLRLTADRNEVGSSRVSRQIPVWDDRETLLPGDFTRDDKAPILCRDAVAWLNAEDDAHHMTAEEANKRQSLAMESIPRPTAIASLPAGKQRPALSDELTEAINKRRFALSGKMALCGNAVIVTGARGPTWPGTDMEQWRAVAVSRSDRSVLWEVRLPVQPALGGMSLTRDGDVLLPLIDGRVVCIGGDAVARPVPAAAVTGAQPGLWARGYAADAVAAGYRFWTPADFAIMRPARTWVLPDLQLKTDQPDDQTVLDVAGYLDVPETGKYTFLGKGAPAVTVAFALLDRSGRFSECACEINMYGGRSDEVFLEKGEHPISLVVLQGPSGKSFSLQWARDGGKPCDIPAAALAHLPGQEQAGPGN